jgi:hypothetical protein
MWPSGGAIVERACRLGLLVENRFARGAVRIAGARNVGKEVEAKSFAFSRNAERREERRQVCIDKAFGHQDP